MRRPSEWLVVPRPNTRAALRLFCLPYSGGGAGLFVPWASMLPATIEVCAVQLPGRETRLSEPAFTQLDQLVEALAQSLLPQLRERPFVLFGHSMGALVAFFLARWLRARDEPQPAHLFLSGHRAAHLPDRHPPAHNLPDAELIAELRRLNGTPREVLDHPELLQIVLPILRADFAVCETYSYRPEPPLPIPISAYGGLEDGDVSREELGSWRSETSAAFTLRMFPGDHFFINTARPLVLQALARELAAPRP